MLVLALGGMGGPHPTLFSLEIFYYDKTRFREPKRRSNGQAAKLTEGSSEGLRKRATSTRGCGQISPLGRRGGGVVVRDWGWGQGQKRAVEGETQEARNRWEWRGSGVGWVRET